MNSRNLFNKAFEQSRENVIARKMEATLSVDSPLLEQVQHTALSHPTLTVEQVLKQTGVSYNQYTQLIKTGFSIPQIRKLQLGRTRELTPAQKKLAASRLSKPRTQQSKSRKYMNKRGGGETVSDDNSNYLINKLQARQPGFNLDQA